VRPKISICIPTYNQKLEYLRECIQSALQQRYDPLEVVVSENHSTNDAPALLLDLKDARLRVVRPPVHLSAIQNFAFCAVQSTGEYVTFLGSDDVLDSDFCPRLAEILDAYPNVAFAHCACRRIDANGKIIGYERSIHPSFVRSGAQEIQRYVWGPRNVFIAALIRRTAYESAGGWGADMEMASDWDLSLRLLTVGDVAYCSDVLASYRTWSTPERSMRMLAQIRDIRLLYERHELSGTFAEMSPRILLQARKQWAISFATGLAALRLSLDEKEQAVREIKLLSDSIAVQARLMLVMRMGMGPLFSNLREIRRWFRQHVKAFLYPQSQSRR